MSRLDRCDVVVGEGSTILAAGAYKDAEGDTRYKYGIKIALPTFTDELNSKLLQVGIHRVMSVKAAGTFNKASDFGTEQDARDFAQQFSTIEGWMAAFEKAQREGGAVRVDSNESLAVKRVANVLKKKHEDGTLAAAKTPVPSVDSPPMTEKGKVNFIAWAKQLKEADHPWYAVAYKQVTQEKGFE